jgi:hypothetical protein
MADLHGLEELGAIPSNRIKAAGNAILPALNSPPAVDSRFLLAIF